MSSMSGISWQQRWLLKRLEQPQSLAQLQRALPDHDQRTPSVRSASLSRSLKRLRERGLVTKIHHWFYRKEFAQADFLTVAPVETTVNT